VAGGTIEREGPAAEDANNGRRVPSSSLLRYDKEANRGRIASLARRVPDDAGSFLFFVEGSGWHEHVHDEAAWVALATGVPTVNGRSGKVPLGWALDRPEVRTPEERHKLMARLQRWARRTGLDPASVTRVKVDPSYHQRR
jgi:hypothetical protein